MVGLREDDSEQDRVDPTIAAAVEAMTNQAGGRRFERCRTGVGRELRVGVEAVTGTEDSSDGSGRQQVDAAELGQR